MKQRGINRRWMTGGVAVTLAVVIVGVAAFSAATGVYYYNAVKTGLESLAKTAAGFFTTYISYAQPDYYQNVYRFTESFEEKDRIELQFISKSGRVERSSFGITAGTSPNTRDIEESLNTGELSAWSGKSTDTGERIMAVSCPVLYSDGSVAGAMRYVTSLKLVDAQILKASAMAAGVGLVLLVMVILSNLYFIRSITEPITRLTSAAKRIAGGSYGIRVGKKYDDEIGDLTDAINEMSAGIGHAEKMQSEFISSVSHELRTPLTAITGWSETLAYDPDIKGDSRKGLEIISKEGARLTKMVEDLLEFTRDQDGRFSLSLRPVDAAVPLEESMATYGELLRKEKIELVYRPSKKPLPRIMADPERLKQVFLNIMDNASKYGREGRRIIITTEASEGYITISTRDFGPGIPDSELPHVKEKFFKGSSKERGSGIGLSVCEEIVVRLGGELKVANARGGGVIVSVKLPVG